MIFPLDIQGANPFFQLIARRYEKTSTIFTSNKTFYQWNEVFADVTVASAILERICITVPLKPSTTFIRTNRGILSSVLDIAATALIVSVPRPRFPLWEGLQHSNHSSLQCRKVGNACLFAPEPFAAALAMMISSVPFPEDIFA